MILRARSSPAMERCGFEFARSVLMTGSGWWSFTTTCPTAPATSDSSHCIPISPRKEVERFTHVDYEDRLALVAEFDDRFIGVGRYDRRPESDVAEVAFVVADDYQHHGIGSLLLDVLASAGRDRGMNTFVADTLRENHPMLDVFFHSGFDVASHCDYGTVSPRFPLAPDATLGGRRRPATSPLARRRPVRGRLGRSQRQEERRLIRGAVQRGSRRNHGIRCREQAYRSPSLFEIRLVSDKEHAKSGAPMAIPPSTRMPIVHARTAASGLGLARYLGPQRRVPASAE